MANENTRLSQLVASQLLWCVAVSGVCGADSRYLAGVQVTQAHYAAKEKTADGFTLDSETGTLRGADIIAQWQHADWAVELQGAEYRGRLAYQGVSQPLFLPVTTQTNLVLSNAAVVVVPPYQWRIDSNVLSGGIGLSERRLKREILASTFTSRLSETLNTTSVLGRMEWKQTLHSQPRVGWLLALQAELPIHQTLDVDTYGVFDAFTEHPAKRSSWLAAFGADAQVFQACTIFMRINYAAYRYGASQAMPVTRNGRVAGIASYPGSHQYTSGLSVGVQVAI